LRARFLSGLRRGTASSRCPPAGPGLGSAHGGILHPDPEGEPGPGAGAADLAEFFGPNAERYLAKYEKLRQKRGQGKQFFLSWNWAVFFLSFTWFFYRKMYAAGAVVLVLPLVLSLVLPGDSHGAGGVAVALALFADYWYVFQALARVAKADALGLEGFERIAFLQAGGGVSRLAGGMALAVWLVIVGLGLLGLAVRLAGPAKGM
jgi:hypothetical protein